MTNSSKKPDFRRAKVRRDVRDIFPDDDDSHLQKVDLEALKEEIDFNSEALKEIDLNSYFLDLEYADRIASGDELRNINSYEYLAYIFNNITFPDNLPPEFKFLINIRNRFYDTETKTSIGYKPKTAYGDIYTNFLLELENSIEQYTQSGISIAGADTPQEVRDIIQKVYANNNKGLERTAKMIDTILETAETPQVSHKHKKAIRKRLHGEVRTLKEKFHAAVNAILPNPSPILNRGINKTNPQKAGSLWEEIRSMVTRNFKPQTTTSMASIREYSYTKTENKNGEKYPIEYRFGTQGQYHKGHPRISPTFEAWLDIQALGKEDKGEITHIYFNNLRYDRADYDYARNREAALTEELHKLEDRHTNIAVITLPADKGLMDQALMSEHTEKISYETASDKMLAIATGIGDSGVKIKDFYISDNVKRQLYGKSLTANGYDKSEEERVLNDLISKSLEKFGFKEKSELTSAQFQMVYFHFIKYELTDMIITKLKPQSFNMSCKDAIDRGGVSSTYYNLMKSIEDGKPLDKDEFNRALHAAPTLVKGRSMNRHIKFIWHIVDTHLNKGTIPPSTQDWLVQWRNENAPHYSHQYFILKLDKHIKPQGVAQGVAQGVSEGKHKKFGSGIFNLFRSKSTDVTPGQISVAATKLQQLLVNATNGVKPFTNVAPFTNEDIIALNNPPLKKLCVDLEKHGLISKQQLTAKPTIATPSDYHGNSKTLPS